MRRRTFRMLGFFVLLFISSVAAAAQRTIEFETREVTEADVTLSPDGQWLIFTMLGHLFRLPVTGGTAEQLTFGPYYDTDPAFSPDGSRVAFVSDRDGSEGNIFVLELASRQITQVTREPWTARPEWSPDGEAIVYLRLVREVLGLVPVSPHSTPATVPALVHRLELRDGKSEILKAPPQVIGSVFYLADGRIGWAVIELVTERGSPRATTRIEVKNPNGTVSTLRTLPGYAAPVVPSPRGDGLYCRRFFPVLPWHTQRNEDFLFVPLPEGSERLIFGSSPVRGWTPCFAVTADGKNVYLSEAERLWRISLANRVWEPIAFTARVRMEIREARAPAKYAFPSDEGSGTPRAILDPRLSPDSRILAFSAAGYLWQQPVDGSKPAQRLTEGSGFESEPAFSPDGQFLAFVNRERGRHELRVLSLESHRIILREQLGGVVPYWNWSLSWSSDGQRLFFVEPDGSTMSVSALSVRSGKKEKLADVSWQAHPSAYPSADGRWLYYTGPPDPGTLYRLPLKEKGHPEPLTQLTRPLSATLVSPDGKWLAFERNTEVWVAPLGSIPVQEENVRQFSSEGGKGFTFSSDGSAIVYSAGNRVWRQPLGGGEREEIRISLELRRATPPPLLLRRVRLLDFRAGGFGPETSLFIEQGRIRWIGSERGRKLPREMTTLDAAGRFAIPGLFDMHGHNTLAAYQDVSIAYGVTSLRSPGDRLDWSNALADRGEASSDPLPRRFFAGEGFQGALPLSVPADIVVYDQQDAQSFVRRWKQGGAHFLKVYWPLSWPLHRAVADEARQQGLPVVGHGSNGVEEVVKSVTLGYASLEHSLTPTRARGDVLQLLAAAGTRWCPTLSTRGNPLLLRDEPERLADAKLRSFTPEWVIQRVAAGELMWALGEHEARGRWVELLASVREAHQRGVKLLIGTDRALLGPSLHWELEYFVQAGIPPLEVLRIATQQAAEAVGAQDDLGTLEPGKLADIVLLDKNPLEDIRNTQTIWRVIKGGWVFDPEKLRPPEGSSKEANPLVPDDFTVPIELVMSDFKLRKLTVGDVDKDYEAVMSSVEHLRGVFGDSWPKDNLTREEDLADLQWHEQEFERRTSFAYAVLSLDEQRLLGCVYVFPAKKASFDAMIILWVRKSEYEKGLDGVLEQTVRTWVREKWPFKRVAYPGREISWSEWKSLPEKKTTEK